MKILTKVNTAEMRTVNGGASKYVYCPICKYKYKTGWIERIFDADATIKGRLSSKHMRGGYYNGSKSVH